MQRMLNWLFIAFFSLNILSIAPVFAQNCSGGGSNKACIEGPSGLFKDNQKAKDSVAAFNWLLLAVSLVACIIFGIKCSKALSDEHYLGAVGPGAGAVVSGIVMFLAYSIVT